MSQFELVCLDLEGTCIVDAGITEECFLRACDETNLPYPEGKEKGIHGFNMKWVIEGLWKEELGADHVAYPHRVKQTFTAFTKLMDEQLEKTDIKLTPGTKEALDYFKGKGWKVAIITGLHRWATDIILEKLGWLDSLNNDYIGDENSPIQLSVCAEDVDKGRPHPDLIRYAMDMFDIEEPELVVSIGDTTADLRCARKAKVGLNLGVANGNNSREKMENIDTNGVLNSMTEVPSFIDQLIAENETEA